MANETSITLAIFEVLGGVALFLYGIKKVTKSLEDLAGASLKLIITQLTKSRFRGFVIGLAVALSVQSSGAVMLMLVAFSNTGLLALGEAVSIILGAGVGTTFTVQLLAFRVHAWAPAMLLFGYITSRVTRSGKVVDTGRAIFSFGLVFLGMHLISAGTAPLIREEFFPAAIDFFRKTPLFAAVMAAIGLDNILPKLKITESARQYSSIGLIVLILGVNFFISLPAMQSIANKKPKKVVFSEEFHHVIGSKFEIYDLFQKNRGSLMAPWLSAYKDSRGIVTENNDVFMEYVIQGQTDILRRRYTPNRVDYELTPKGSGAMVFGIGYDEGWFAADGRRLYETNGLVTADFNSGDKHITLQYRTPYFYLGLIVSLLAIAGCLSAYINKNFGKRFKAILE